MRIPIGQSKEMWKCKSHQLGTKFVTNVSGANWWPNSCKKQHLTNKLAKLRDAIAISKSETLNH